MVMIDFEFKRGAEPHWIITIDTRITVLDIRNHGITELPDLSALTELEVLYCQGNRLKNLNGISNLTKLTSLFCHCNELESLPDLSKLTNLLGIYCGHNQLEVFPDIGSLTNLQVIDFTNNKMKILPENLANLRKVKYFNYSDNPIGDIPYPVKKWIKKIHMCVGTGFIDYPTLTESIKEVIHSMIFPITC